MAKLPRRSNPPGPNGPPPAAPGEWVDLHLWEMQPIRDILVLLAVIGLLYLGYLLRLVTIPLMLAMLLAYLFEPLVAKLVRRYSWMSRHIAAGAIIVLAAVFVAVPVILGVSYGLYQTARLVTGASENAVDLYQFLTNAQLDPLWGEHESEADFLARQTGEQGEAAVAAYKEMPDGVWRSAARWIASSVDAKQQIMAWLNAQTQQDDQTFEAWMHDHAGNVATGLTQGIVGTGNAILGVGRSVALLAFSAFLTAFFFFFFSSSYGRLLAFWESLIPERRKGHVVDMLRKMDRVIAGFIRGRLTIAAIQSGIFSLAYLAVGVPAAFLIGIAVGFLSIVPYLALIGMPVSIGLMFLDPPGGFRGEWWWMTFAPIAVYFIGQTLDDYVLTPLIQGKSTDLDSPTVLFASLAGGVLAGVYGLLLAIPVAACLKIVVREVVWPRFQAWAEGRAKDPLPIENQRTGETPQGS